MALNLQFFLTFNPPSSLFQLKGINFFNIKPEFS
ncbi:hypothetical protein AN394_01657 [Pseudoalteromonas sp. P1-26]|nr:hypothetical protein AN213_02783 [Pseudoalteromonas sp. P1-8]KPZ72707.1 hypothetical protein AN394_01657 [Pseudoalteromonas sp. P1-26]